MKRRCPTEEELALWRRAMRDTRPLRGRGGEPGPGEAGPEPRTRAPAPKAEPVADPRPSPAAGIARSPGGLDAAAQRRLRRGRLKVEARVDLHGMRQAEAYPVLVRFIAESQAAGRRCVLVITGRGGRSAPAGEAAFMLREGDGVLRRQVPLWLGQEPNASRVFAIEQAHPRHGGAGAFYVFLRKNRGGARNS